MSEAGPTDPSDRSVSLDALRGFALAGIPFMNVQAFAMPVAAYLNPTVYGDLSGLNAVAWWLTYLLTDQKFMTLFTVLYGAGVVLFTESKEARGQPALRLHYRRTAWLLLIGIVHAYLVWYGDILVVYGLCGLWVVGCRHWKPQNQLALGLALLVVPGALMVGLGWNYDRLPTAMRQTMERSWDPTPESLRREVRVYRGSWQEQFPFRVGVAWNSHTIQFMAWSGWRISGLMLLGMALFRWGLLTNQRSPRFYRWLVFVGAAGGLPLVFIGGAYNWLHYWQLPQAPLFGLPWNYVGSVLLAGAYLGGVMLLCRYWSDGWLVHGLACLGRMAFTNYLLQTLMGTMLFYGYGLGWFGSVDRVGQFAVAAGIIAVQLPLSVLWLNWFRYGPVEWVWRLLTYGRWEPIRRSDRST